MAKRRTLQAAGILLAAAGLLFGGLTPGAAEDLAPKPEAAGGAKRETVEPVRATRHMVAAANPHAARAGRRILRDGGSAVDAAIAMQMVLNLVEPQSSGIGGGGFFLHYSAESREIVAYDGRETAPAAADARMFLKPDGTRMGFYDAVVGGLAVGTPGVVRMLALAHADHGKLPWQALFQPAIELAREGFQVSPRLHDLIARDRFLKRYPATQAYFHTEAGEPLPVGAVLRNPDLADSLSLIADKGPDAFYRGEIARDIARAVQNVPDNPGRLTVQDLAKYDAKRRAPICRPYRVWNVCGMPPPTSGGVTVLQILGILSHFDLGAAPPLSTRSAHLLSEAGRLAFADRNRFLADPDFVDMPLNELLSSEYLGRRAGQIRKDAAMGRAEPGLPFEAGDMPAQEEPPSTTHLVAVDSEGNAVSFTSSIENAFGSRVMVRGFLLNNQLTDFSFQPVNEGRQVANSAAPGKRPRSSMSPMIVLDAGGAFELATGSPGGSRIIGYVAQNLIAMLDWGMDPQAAAAMPHALSRNGPTELEAGSAFADLADELRAMGHEVRIDGMVSGAHSIRRTQSAGHENGKGGYLGGADPRREGVALGD